MKPCLLLFYLSLFCAFLSSQAQEKISVFSSPESKKEKGTLYFAMGLHRVFFSKSDIRLRSNKSGYDFTLHKVKAKDDNDLRIGEGFDAPQYSLRIGYFFNKNTGIEFNYDHVKYIAIQNQKVHVSGQISGIKINKDTVLGTSFVEYEHTDGANYYLFNFIKTKTVFSNRKGTSDLNVVVKPGLGFVLPRTDSRVLGREYNDHFHLAGYVIAMDGGLRYDFLKHFYMEASAKVAFANYRDALIYNGRARQHWWSLQLIALAGIQFPL